MTTSRSGCPGHSRRRRRRPLRTALILLAVAVAGGIWLNWQCWGLQVTKTQVELADLPRGFDGLRMVHLSDLHGHQYGEDSRDLLSLVEAQQPEMILLTGDLIDQAGQLEMIPALAQGLAAIAPCYYVTGNHEWSVGTGTVRKLKEILSDCGVTVLSNQFKVLERGGDRLALAGVDDPNGFADQKSPERLYQETQEAGSGIYTVLLAHRNDCFGQYAGAGYDLVLSGHGHGGIVRLPFTDGLLGTDRRFFPTWTAGVYTQGESTLFVSRGVGNNTVPISGFRLFNRPEVAVVILKAVGG